MGGTWHLDAVEAPEVPASKNNLMLDMRLQEKNWHAARVQGTLSGSWRLASGHQHSSFGCKGRRCQCRGRSCQWCRLASLELTPAGISSPGKRPCTLGRHRRQPDKLPQALLLQRLLLREGARPCCPNRCGQGQRNCRFHRNLFGAAEMPESCTCCR